MSLERSLLATNLPAQLPEPQGLLQTPPLHRPFGHPDHSWLQPAISQRATSLLDADVTAGVCTSADQLGMSQSSVGAISGLHRTMMALPPEIASWPSRSSLGFEQHCFCHSSTPDAEQQAFCWPSIPDPEQQCFCQREVQLEPQPCQPGPPARWHAAPPARHHQKAADVLAEVWSAPPGASGWRPELQEPAAHVTEGHVAD